MSVLIYQPTRNAMQSGKSKDYWLVKYEESNTRFADELMGWESNSDTKQELNLRFKSLELAVEYAQRKGLKYQIIEPNTASLKIQAYADNFK